MPTCKGDDTKDILKQIIKRELGNDVKVSFNGFATNETDKAKKQVTCQVMAKVKKIRYITQQDIQMMDKYMLK